MTFNESTADGTVFIRLNGDLIGESAGPAILERADRAIGEGNLHCIINISEVRYINSSGIGVLITLLTKFRNHGGELFLVNPSEHVNKLLIMTKLRNIFNIADSENEAVEKIK